MSDPTSHRNLRLDPQPTAGCNLNTFATNPQPDEIERVAEACHHASCANVPQHRPGYDPAQYPWDEVHENGKEIWRKVATAAIAAMDTRLREQIAAKDAQIAEYEALWDQIEAFAQGRIEIRRAAMTDKPVGGV